MLRKQFLQNPITLILLVLVLIVVSGCSSKSELVVNAEQLCEANLEKMSLRPVTGLKDDTDITSPLSSPALILYKNSYKGSGEWTAMSLLPDYLESSTEMNTIVCINENIWTEAKYQSGARAYKIFWNVQLFSYPDGTIYKIKQFYDENYIAPKFKTGSSSIYSDPPEKRQVSNWVLSELQVKLEKFTGELIQDFTLSQSGGRLAIAYTGQGATKANLEVWDVAAETLVHRFDDIDVKRIAFSPDGKLLASTYKNFIRLFDMEDFKEKTGIEEISSKEIISLDFSPDSMYLAAGFDEGLVLVWDMKSHQIVFTYIENEKDCSGAYIVTFFPDGNKLAGGNDGCLKVWDLKSSGQLKRINFGHVTDISISSDGTYLAFGNVNAKIFIFDTETWKLIEDFRGYSLKEDIPVSTITFLPGSSILVGNTQNDLYFWDIETGKELGRIKMRPHKIITFPDGKSLAIWGDDGISFLDIGEYIQK